MGFIGAERHTSGDIHVHGLISPGVRELHRSYLWDDLFRLYGISRLEPAKGIDNVATYCAKYITKDLAAWLML